MPQVGQVICLLPGAGVSRPMQLGLWHLTLPNVRVPRSDSDEETLSLSAMLYSFNNGVGGLLFSHLNNSALPHQFIIMNFYTRDTSNVNPFLHKNTHIIQCVYF
jgi:hypothetical protein